MNTVIKKKLFIVGLITALALSAVFIFAATKSSTDQNNTSSQTQNGKALSKVILNVENMSCGGCISTIKSSLSGIEGIEDCRVDISGGTAEVVYDNQKLKDINRIAVTITQSGYPATIFQVITPDQMKKEKEKSAISSKRYIAAVGEWNIPRENFNADLVHAKIQYTKVYGENAFSSTRGKRLLDNLKVQIVQQQIREGILMQEIKRADFKVDPSKMDQALKEFLDSKGVDMAGFEQDLKENGYPFDYFLKKFHNQVLIDNFLEEKVFSGSTNGIEKRRRYASWFKNASVMNKVVYYDKEIAQLIQNQPASSCCSVQ
ncbi:MAG: cation transporter [Deltaproteobacteria bacterium]|nr:cation transporter [Deltaproteobacteria bacterium]